MRGKTVRWVLVLTVLLLYLVAAATAAAAPKVGQVGKNAPHGPAPTAVQGPQMEPGQERLQEQTRDKLQVKDRERLTERVKEETAKKEQVRAKVNEALGKAAAGKRAEAIADLTAAAQIYPSGELYTALGRMYLEDGNETEALANFEQAVALDPTQSEVLSQLGKLYRERKMLGLKVFVNGQAFKAELPSVIKEGTTLVPLRALAARLKAEVAYDATTKTVTLVKDGVTVTLDTMAGAATLTDQLGTTRVLPLPVSPEVVSGSTFVPLRFIAEAFAANVFYDNETGIVVISERQEEDELAAEDGTSDTAESSATEETADTGENEADTAGAETAAEEEPAPSSEEQ